MLEISEIGLKWLQLVQIKSEQLKTFKNDRNELNQSKLAPYGQNQYRMSQNVQKWVKMLEMS